MFTTKLTDLGSIPSTSTIQFGFKTGWWCATLATCGAHPTDQPDTQRAGRAAPARCRTRVCRERLRLSFCAPGVRSISRTGSTMPVRPLDRTSGAQNERKYPNRGQVGIADVLEPVGVLVALSDRRVSRVIC